jgi:hypothetical protein
VADADILDQMWHDEHRVNINTDLTFKLGNTKLPTTKELSDLGNPVD